MFIFVVKFQQSIKANKKYMSNYVCIKWQGEKSLLTLLKSYICLFQLPHSFWNIPDSKLFFRIYFVMNDLKCTTIFMAFRRDIIRFADGYEYGNKSCGLLTSYTLTGDECCSNFALRVRWRVLAWAPYALPAALRRLLNKMRLHFIVTFYWFSEWPAS